jgi:hypothetical protein
MKRSRMVAIVALVFGWAHTLAAGNAWLQPSYGANGVSYRVVPTP